MSSTETIVKREQGENVIYKNSGICRIAEIKAMSFAPGEEKMYYVLEPVYSQGSRTYVPTDSVELNACMRSLLDQKQIDDVIIQSQAQELEWVADTKQRAVYWNEVISTYDRAKILAVMLCLNEHKLKLEKSRKKMYASDLKMLSLTERMIKDEFAFVLKIQRDEVMDYINGHLSE